MNEIDGAAKLIEERLTSDAALNELIDGRVYDYEAPSDAVYPFVTIALQPGTRSLLQAGGGGQRLLMYPRWLILAVLDRNDMPAVREIAAAVDAALSGASGTITLAAQDYFIQTVTQEQPLESGGSIKDIFYARAGGYYESPVHSV